MVNTTESVRALFAAIPDPATILITVAFVVAATLLVGMAVAGRGH